MGDIANLIPSSPFDGVTGFTGGEGGGGLMPSLPSAAPSYSPTFLDPSSFPSTSSIDRSLDASIGTPQPVYAGGGGGGGGLPYNIPAPYAPPGGGVMAPPDVTVASAVPPGTTAAQFASLTGGVYQDPITGQISQGDSAGGGTAIPTATSPPPAAPVAGVPDINEEIAKWSQYGQDPASQAALARVLGGNQPGFIQRNILDPFKKSGVGELLGVGLPAAGLIKQLASMSGGQTPLSPLQQEQLNAMRAQRGMAEQFMTGQVPAGMQQSLQNQAQAEIQQIKSRYAQMGMSGSTAEMQDIAAAQARATARLGQAQSNMIAQGAAMLGMPATITQQLSREQLAQDAAFNDSLAQFVAALSGGPPTKRAA